MLKKKTSKSAMILAKTHRKCKIYIFGNEEFNDDLKKDFNKSRMD